MIKNHLRPVAIIGLFCCLNTGFAQKSDSEIKKQQKDFAVFKKSLLTIESKLDRGISMDSIQRFIAAGEAEFGSKVLSAVEEFKWFATCTHLVQSGHTQVSPSKEVVKEYVLKARSLPFDMVIVDKKVYVADFAKKKQSSGKKKKQQVTDDLPVGAEIVAIDGATIPQWMEKIGRYIGSDENDPVFKYVVAGQAFDFYRFIATDVHKPELKVRYIVKRDTLEETIRLSYPPLQSMEERFDLQEEQQKKDKKSFGTFKFIGGDVAYFRFPSFYDNHGGRYNEYLEKQFTKIKKRKKIETVVIDLRGNGGGNVQTVLLSYFMQEQQPVGSYRIDKRLKGRQLKNVKKSEAEYRRYRQNTRKFKRFEKKYRGFDGQLHSLPIDTSLIFKGNIVVLTDEGTFSAASLLASQLKTNCNAKIMGSRPGGTYYQCNAGTLTVVLPHSKIKVILNPNSCGSSLNAANFDPTIKDVDVEIVPKYDPKPSNYKKNWEEVIKKALKEVD